ncbi:MAG: YaeQ family protein, partial [Candidatus Omnitrophica bacterium]|nr:YaeQ family protein [Candidatus Omnitrophota bacterium]
MIEKFSFELQLGKIRKKMIFVKAEGEKREHVVLKVLAYMLFFEPELKVEVDIGMHYKPDLVVMAPGEHVPSVWIDCGQVTILKVQSLARKLKHSRIIFMKQTQRELQQFKKLIERKVEDESRIECIAFDEGFVPEVAQSLERTNQAVIYP